MNKLVATTLESKFHVFDTRTQHPTKGFASVTEKVSIAVLQIRRGKQDNLTIFSHKSMYCNPSLELSNRDGSKRGHDICLD